MSEVWKDVVGYEGRYQVSKLCLADVRIIKQRIADGESDEVISASFPVSPYSIKSIRNGQNWRHA